MLIVTTAALDRLSEKLAGKNANDGRAFRFTQRTGCWRLRLDQARPDDTTFAHKGKNVLVVDAAVAEAMAKMMLDVRGTEAGVKLRLHRMTRGSE